MSCLSVLSCLEYNSRICPCLVLSRLENFLSRPIPDQLTNFQILSLTWFLGSVTYTGAGWILSGPTLESIFSRVISHKWKSHMILFAKKKWRYKFSWIVSLAPLCSCFAILIKQLQAMTWRPSFWPCKKVPLSPSEWHWKKKSSITQNVCKNIKISL